MEQVKKVIIDKERCKGCKLCLSVCPVEIIQLSDDTNSYGYNTAEVIEQKECLSCGNCARICPDLAIKVFKESK
ncbi:MAG: indolepyruvate ferredoxin oxidoreductase subunit alpha [Halanaerobiaceae bacterium]